MARTALGRLKEAKELDALSDSLKKRDPTNSDKIQTQANRLRASAVRQLAKRPKRKARVAAGVIPVAGKGPITVK